MADWNANPQRKLPTQVTGVEVMIKTLRQRIERVLMFAAELAGGLQREFQARWAAAAPEAPALELRQRVDALQQAVERGRAAYLGARHQEQAAELAALQAIDLNALTQEARGLEALARAQRERAAAASEARVPTPLAERGGLTGTLARWAGSPQVLEAAAAGIRRVGAFIAEANEAADRELAGRQPAPAKDPAFEKDRQAFEGAYKLVGDILAYVGPRLALVKVALDACGLPGRTPPWEQVARAVLPSARAAAIPNGQMTRLAHLTKQVYGDAPTTMKAHQALVQHDDARSLHDDAELLERGLAAAEPARGKTLLQQFNVAKYRAAIFPLSHLHVAFGGVPHFGELFPPPAGVATTAALNIRSPGRTGA